MSVTMSAGSSGTMRSPSTKRPPGFSCAAMRRKRSAFSAPSRWCTASAENTRSNSPSGSGSWRSATRRSAPGSAARACSSMPWLSSIPTYDACGWYAATRRNVGLEAEEPGGTECDRRPELRRISDAHLDLGRELLDVRRERGRRAIGDVDDSYMPELRGERAHERHRNLRTRKHRVARKVD